MIEIDNKILSDDLFTSDFCCDLQACKGICCVEGNAGAPLENHERTTLEQTWTQYSPFMKPEGIKAIEKQGFAVLDEDGDLTTPLINEAECAYSIEHNGGTWCAIEKAWSQGLCSFRKPISCHLYPIRETKFSNGTVGLQYHRWNVCRAAELLGRKKRIPVYKAVKDAIISRYGKEFYEAMEEVEKLVKE